MILCIPSRENMAGVMVEGRFSVGAGYVDQLEWGQGCFDGVDRVGGYERALSMSVGADQAAGNRTFFTGVGGPLAVAAGRRWRVVLILRNRWLGLLLLSL